MYARSLSRESQCILFILLLGVRGIHSPILGARSEGSWTELMLGKEAEEIISFFRLSRYFTRYHWWSCILTLEFDKHLHVWPFRKI